jgi:hypothetical protein
VLSTKSLFEVRLKSIRQGGNKKPFAASVFDFNLNWCGRGENEKPQSEANVCDVRISQELILKFAAQDHFRWDDTSPARMPARRAACFCGWHGQAELL